jgi:hypothetical protein
LGGASLGCGEGPDGDGLAAEDPATGALATSVVAKLTADNSDFASARYVPAVSASSTGKGYIRELGKSYTVVENANLAADDVRHELITWNGNCGDLGHGACLLFNARGIGGSGFTDDESMWSNDRLEAVLDQSLAFGSVRYLRFYVRFDPEFKLATDPALQADPTFKAKYDGYYGAFDEYDYIMSQTWQISSSAISTRGVRGPAFAIYLLTNPDAGLLTMSFRYRNDATGTCVYKDTNPPRCQSLKYATEFHRVVVQKGRWYNFTIKLAPRLPKDGMGEILIWKDRYLQGPLVETEADNYKCPPESYCTRVDQHRRFKWGFTPDANVRLGEVGLGNTFAVRLGFYRAIPSTHSPFRMDSIKLTTTQAAMESGL